MSEFIHKRTTVVIAGLALLAALLAAVAWAAPGDSDGPGTAGVDGTATVTATETGEATETAEATETEEAGTPEATETEEPEGTPDNDVGVPLDSPACAGDLEHPTRTIPMAMVTAAARLRRMMERRICPIPPPMRTRATPATSATCMATATMMT